MEESGGIRSSAFFIRRNSPTLLVLLSIAFGISYSQSPLFTSNQNQYFLHGISRAGRGYLNNDWLANTVDPTPVFSAFVYFFSIIFRHQEVFHIVFLVALGIYFLSCLGIARQIGDIGHPLASFSFIVIFVLIHSSGFRYILGKITNPEWAYLFEGGLAGQRVLGTVLQPSSLGIFFFLSIYLYLIRRYAFAALTVGLAVVFHPTYLLPGMMVLLAYFWGIYQNGNRAREAFIIGSISSLLFLPVALYVLLSFRPSSPAEFARAQEILVHFRIPHHALISEWFDLSSIIQLLMVILATYLVRNTKLFPIFAVGLCAGFFLSILQIIMASNSLAVLFPWRISSILVPLATTVILALFVETSFRRRQVWLESHNTLVYLTGCFLILVAMVAGVVYFIQEYSNRYLSPENDLYRYVMLGKEAGEIYLTPIDMQDFRLATGAAAYIDFKSIPYQDREVIEWHRRVLQASDFYRKKRIDCRQLQNWLNAEGITHLVLSTDQKDPDCGLFQELFANHSYRLFEYSQ